MPPQVAQTFSRYDIAAKVLRRLGVCGEAEKPSSVAARPIVDGYEALYAEIDWQGEAPWDIDLAPRRVQNAVTNILAARFSPDRKGGPQQVAAERVAWMQFYKANALAPSYWTIQGEFS
jgi:hypothetical protein